jgi:hypothetical protein
VTRVDQFMDLPVLRTDQDILISKVFPIVLSRSASAFVTIFGAGFVFIETCFMLGPMLLPNCSCLSGVKSICTTTLNVSQGVTSISAHIGLKTPQYSVSVFEKLVILLSSSSYFSDIVGDAVTISGSGFIHSSFMSCLFGSKHARFVRFR